MKELLDTDRVNFLVWKYLLESNYRGTAAKLQQEWRVKEPHRGFDFSPHVHDYALITLLNKGLLYEATERQFIESRRSQQAPATAGSRGVFGPLKFERSRTEEQEDGDEDEEEDSVPRPESSAEDVENTRKRPVEGQHHGLPNGSAAKRQRLSNGYENGADSATTPMEIDHGDNNHAYPSPLEGEQAASPRPRTDGPSRGTQIDKIYELAQETVFLRLGPDDAIEGAEASPARANENPLVLHCEWNPKDPSCLAAAGTDALARVWTVSRGAGVDNNQPDHVNGITRPFVNLLDDDVPRGAVVTALAWNPRGDAIAVAVDLLSNRSRVSIIGPDGTTLHRFEGLEAPVLKLRWSPNNDLLLCISPEGNGALITIFSSSAAESVSHYLDYELQSDSTLDGAWISDTEFLLCGGDILASFQCVGNEIVVEKRFPTNPEDSWNQVHFDSRSKLVAIGSDKGVIDILEESGQRRSIQAHIGPITVMQWQPLQAEPAEDVRLLASAGEDGAICIWNARRSEMRVKYSMTMSLPVIGLSMTPDGAFIAGATSERILVWKIGEHTFPKATWTRVQNSGWQSPKANPDGDDDFIPNLSWDSEGQKLVYAANSRLAVINFR